MKKRIFAKIVETSDYQVLITKECDDEEGLYGVAQHLDADDARLCLSLNFKSEEARDKVFDSYSTESADRFVDSMRELID